MADEQRYMVLVDLWSTHPPILRGTVVTAAELSMYDLDQALSAGSIMPVKVADPAEFVPAGELEHPGTGVEMTPVDVPADGTVSAVPASAWAMSDDHPAAP